MMTDKAPADSRLPWRMEDGDIWRGKGGTQEFPAIEIHTQNARKKCYGRYATST